MSQPQPSEFRIEKRRAEADLTLATGATIRGCFFLSSSSSSHAGPERVGDLLNAETGFIPFELTTGDTALYNRSQIVLVRLPPDTTEPQLEPGYEVATRCPVSILLSTGRRVSGTVSIFCPVGRDRLSDYTRTDHHVFRYVELADHALIVNTAHIVELRERGTE